MRDAVVLIAEENRMLRDETHRPAVAGFGNRVLADLAMLCEDMAQRGSNPLVRYAARPGRQGPTANSHYIKEARTALGAAAEARFSFLKKFAGPSDVVSKTAACDWVIKRTDEILRAVDLTAGVLFESGEWDKTTPERMDQQSPLGRTDRQSDDLAPKGFSRRGLFSHVANSG